MKKEHKGLSPIELSLLTWYPSDHPLYKDPEHPTIKLAGEIGELLDLYAKDKFKPGFDWMVCKHCNLGIANGHRDNECVVGNLRMDIINPTFYTPLVLDELGDIWYYLRILAWQADIVFLLSDDDWYTDDYLDCIKDMYRYASNILYARLDEIETALQEIYYYLNIMLVDFSFTIEQLTELNYYKLNSEESNHGWKGA